MKGLLLTLALILALVVPVMGDDLGSTLISKVKLNCSDQAGATIFNWYWSEQLGIPGQPWQIWGMVYFTVYNTCEAER